MSEEFGPNFITLTDEDGNDIELEYVDALEDNGQTYMAFFPTVDDETDEAAADLLRLALTSEEARAYLKKRAEDGNAG